MARRLALLFLLLTLCSFGQSPTTATLQGSIVYGDGTGFNGTLKLSLARPTVVNTCVTPVQVINAPQATIPVVNGTVTPSSVLLTDCLKPRIPYYMQLIDARGSPLVTDNWYVPNLSTGIFDIGSLIATNYAAGVTVSLPSAITASPAGSQTVTQPGGTSFSINNLIVTSSFSPPSGFSGTKTAGSCTLTVVNGIITGITGC